MKTIYEWTGEYRPPKKGETFLTVDTLEELFELAVDLQVEPSKALTVAVAVSKDDYETRFWILRPRQIDEVDDGS